MNLMKNQEGQAVLETALILPVILFLIMGIITLSLFIYTKTLVVISASQGARVGAQIWMDTELTQEEKNEKIEKVVFGILSNGMKGLERTWEANEEDGSLKIKVTYNFKLVLPLLGDLFENGTVPVVYEAQYYIEGQ